MMVDPAAELSDAELADMAEQWLGELEKRLAARSADELAELFSADAHWRDVVALTWTLGQTRGREAVVQRLISSSALASNWRISSRLPAPRVALAFSKSVVQVFFEFDLPHGRGNGVVRLVPEPQASAGARAWLLLTNLASLHGAEKSFSTGRGRKYGYDSATSGETWAEYRERRRSFADRAPEVLVVGASQAGVMMAARLEQVGVDALVIDKSVRVGDAWRNRYEALALHIPTAASSFPYLPFPETFPKYLSKDKVAEWIEFYAKAMDLNVWTETEFIEGSYDEEQGAWWVTVSGPSGSRTLRPRHVVLAIGAFGQTPNIPLLPGLTDFDGPVLHTAEFRTGSGCANQRVLIIGAGTSAHDVALDLYHHGADVTLVQRGPITIISLTELEETSDAGFPPGVDLEMVDLLTAAHQVFPLAREQMVRNTIASSERDADLIDRLNRAGLRTDTGEDGTGWQMKAWRTGAGYYIDVGASEVVASGGIHVMPATDLASFVNDGVELTDGRRLQFDAVVLATGFLNAEMDVARLFGREVADKIGPVYRMDDHGTGEWHNAWGPTAQEGLWFMVGGMPQVRPYSLTVALQIKARLLGLVPEPAQDAQSSQRG